MAIDGKSSWPALAAALASLLLAVFFIWLTGARFQQQKGLNLLEQNDWPAARARLLRAAAAYGASVTVPWYVPANDARRLYTALGDSFLAEAASVPETAAILTVLKNAETWFRAALSVQPLDVPAQTGLARTVAALERGFAWFAPGEKNPYQAAAEFEKLLRLRPNGIEAHFLFIRYLNGSGKDDKRLQELTRDLAAIAPQNTDALRRYLEARPDWRDKLEPALSEGLRAAIAENNNSVMAYRALSFLAAGRGDFPAALDDLRQALTLQAAADGGDKPNQAPDYSRLAGLYLRQNDGASAQEAALKALRLGANRDQALRGLWQFYKENGSFQPFLDLLAEAEKTMRLPEARRVLQAACLVELGDTAAAKTSLALVKDPQYQAEALRLLAELARRDKDWDAMELAAQRATVIEPKNSSNFYLFALSLRSQKKYRQAAAAMDQAIAAASKEDPWLYNFRAWNRWDDQQLEAARADWLKAIKLLPDNAGLYRSLAMTYEKEGGKLQAIAAMKKAVALAPGNADFVKKLQELQK